MESATFVPLNRGYKVNLEIGYEMETAASSPLKTGNASPSSFVMSFKI
ncbi:hypothetical protein AXX17_AT5G53380 [Arabidopsis thaliana]|uniref:Uncharacterized protein n=1 Tax=Arabidopsis thaliana TaxID=3702 RepID=A0A178UBT6_ARATH|nr:hypothetical protein AXX17_AT5G53380 [Arabidopsis thaliana]